MLLLVFPLVELLGMVSSPLVFVRNLCRTREQKFELILLFLLNYFVILCLVCKYKTNGKLTFHYKSFIICCLLFVLFSVSLSVASTVSPLANFFWWCLTCRHSVAIYLFKNLS